MSEHVEVRGFTMEPDPANPALMRQTAYCRFCAAHRPDEDPRWPCGTARLAWALQRSAEFGHYFALGVPAATPQHLPGPFNLCQAEPCAAARAVLAGEDSVSEMMNAGEAEIARLRAAALAVIEQSILAPERDVVRVSIAAWRGLNRALGSGRKP